MWQRRKQTSAVHFPRKILLWSFISHLNLIICVFVILRWFFSDETPVVYYGKDPSLLKFRATGTSKTYQRSDMCGPPASLWICFRNPGYIHDVLLTGLTPSIQYFYSYGSSEVCW